MNYEEAKRLLLIHGGCFPGDESGKEFDGFLPMLRPYRGLREQHFHSVMEGLFTVAASWEGSESVDRELIQALWSTCLLARSWGLRPNGMLQSNKLITAQDSLRLEKWIDIIEWTATRSRCGHPVHFHIDSYCEYIANDGPGENPAFLLPLMHRHLEDPENLDPSTVIKAAGRLGPLAKDLLPALQQVASRTYSDWCQDDVRSALKDAIPSITGNTV